MSASLYEWGLQGIQALQAQVGVFVIVDVLSFCTAVDVAVSRGGIVHPWPFDDEQGAAAEAVRPGAVLSRRRKDARDGLSLSPVNLMGVQPGMHIVLPSPTGRCCHSLRRGRSIAFLCWRGVFGTRPQLPAWRGRWPARERFGVIAAGERWPDGSLRPAIEDWLGAGAILDRLDWPCSPEAEVAREAYRAAGNRFGAGAGGCRLCW
jgi:2-phosphosulfolactate phosphatase